MVTLRTSDQKDVVVPRRVALSSVLIREMLVDDDDDEPAQGGGGGGDGLPTPLVLPLPNVDAKTLTKVVEFCKHHVDDPMPSIARPIKSNDMKEIMKDSLWDAEFVDQLSQDALFDVILAANYMAIEPLLDLGCAKIASTLKGKTPKEIRALYNIAEPTKEEEEQVLRDNAWIFEVAPTSVAAAAPTVPAQPQTAQNNNNLADGGVAREPQARPPAA